MNELVIPPPRDENSWKELAEYFGITQTAFAVFWNYLSKEEREQFKYADLNQGV